jgi:hypothetical protein
MTLLDFIESLPADDPAQMHAKEWAQRARELMRRMAELGDQIVALVAADDPGELDAFVSAVAERRKVTDELSQLNRMHGEFLSRLRPAPETRQ